MMPFDCRAAVDTPPFCSRPRHGRCARCRRRGRWPAPWEPVRRCLAAPNFSSILRRLVSASPDRRGRRLPSTDRCRRRSCAGAGRHGDAQRRQSPRRTQLYPLARHPIAERDGRRARPHLSRHRARRRPHLPLPGQAERTYCITAIQSFRSRSGFTARHHRPSGGYPRASTAITSSFCPTGAMKRLRRSPATSNSRATTTTSISAHSAPLPRMRAAIGSSQRSRTASNGAACA